MARHNVTITINGWDNGFHHIPTAKLEELLVGAPDPIRQKIMAELILRKQGSNPVEATVLSRDQGSMAGAEMGQKVSQTGLVRLKTQPAEEAEAYVARRNAQRCC